MLCALAKKYGVDKCPAIFHSYTPAYHQILEASREKVSKVIEIGIGYPEMMVPIVGPSYSPGASLRMWRDYFPNAQIIGCDIRRSVFFQEDRISCRMLDQSDKASLQGFKESMGSADVIIDDGSHEPEHMKLSFQMLWDLITPGGFYIIEDVRRKDIQEFINLHFIFKNCHVVYAHHGRTDWDSFVCYKKSLSA